MADLKLDLDKHQALRNGKLLKLASMLANACDGSASNLTLVSKAKRRSARKTKCQALTV
ncbi:hypothetical protein O9993_03185 [Vibrio lentus]|nr:hypothetical protein [Vibrio lentus]